LNKVLRLPETSNILKGLNFGASSKEFSLISNTLLSLTSMGSDSNCDRPLKNTPIIIKGTETMAKIISIKIVGKTQFFRRFAIGTYGCGV